jgi:hypothetical protein
MIKKILLPLVITLGLTQTTQAQVGCDMMNLIVNVGSDTNMVNIYHPGHYLTWPQSENVIVWEIKDMIGNMIAEDTLVDEAFYEFYHSIPITDTMNVTALLINESAGIACLIEDQLYWEVTEVIPGFPTGRWEFLHGNLGEDVTIITGIDNIESTTARVYPNPSSDEINISIDKGQLQAIEIYNLTGSLVFKTNLNSNNIKLKIDSYPSGIYLMRIFDQKNEVTNSIIIKN